MSQFQPKLNLELPRVIELDPSIYHGLSAVVLDRLDRKYIQEGYAMFQENTQKGVGFSSTEFPTLEVYERRIFVDNPAFGMFDKDTGKLLGLFNISPSPLCRSQKPIMDASYMAVAKKKNKVGTVLLASASVVAQCLGYHSFLGRTSLCNTAMNTATQRAVGAVNLGVMPYNSHLKGVGWGEDVIKYIDFHFPKVPHITEAVKLPQNKPTIYKLPRPDCIRPDTWDIEFEPIATANGTIQKATQNQRFIIEGLIHSAAQRGDGFAIDEFTPEGLLNRKFFKRSITLALVSGNDDVKGAMILGPSGLSREEEPLVLHAYAIDKDGDKRVEKELVKSALYYAKKQKYKGLSSDAYSVDSGRMNMMTDLGFQATGYMPYCGYVQGFGYMGSFVLFYQFPSINYKALGIKTDIMSWPTPNL